MKQNQKKNHGITLVALTVTIVILLILVGVTLSYNFKDKDMITSTHETSFKARWAKYLEKVDTYVTWKIAQNMNFDTNSVNSGNVLLKLIEQNKITDIQESDIHISMDQIIGKIDESDEEYIVVYHGRLCYVKDTTNEDAEQQANWCREMEIPILELR